MARVNFVLIAAFAAVVAIIDVPMAAGQAVEFRQRLSGTVAANQFGTVDVDGAWAVVGAVGENGQRGAAYAYEDVAGVWTERQRLVAPDGVAGDSFGYSVAISGDTIAIGAYQLDLPGLANVGAIYIFVRSGATWSPQAKLMAANPSVAHLLGTVVRIDGNLVVSGGTGADRSASLTNTGAVHVFERSGSTWTEHRIEAPGPVATDDRFGWSVDVSGATICVGSSNLVNGVRGSTYVFRRTAAGWSFEQQLGTPPGAFPPMNRNCAMSGDTLVTNATQLVAPYARAVHVFVRAGGTWTFQATVQPTDGAALEGFAASTYGLAIVGDRIVAGSGAANQYQGAAHVFDRVGGVWSERQRLNGTGLVPNDQFGNFIGFDGSSLFVGAPHFPQSPTSLGSVHIYRSLTGPGVPGLPSSFTATAAGNVVHMSWGAPSSGAAPSGYTLFARAPGGPLLVTAPLGAVTSFSAAAPNGTYVLSLAATNAVGTGPESPPVTVVLPASVAAPGPPSGLAASVTGTTVAFTWNAPSAGGAVANYLLVAGTSPGFAVPVASVTLGGTPGVSIPGVPPGTYHVRVLALNSGGTSGASNEVSISVGAGVVPGAPTLNPASVAGRTVTLSWTAGTGSATSFTLRAFAPAGPLLVTVPGLTGTSVGFSGVPSGSYELELAGVNATGTGASSNRILLVVP